MPRIVGSSLVCDDRLPGEGPDISKVYPALSLRLQHGSADFGGLAESPWPAGARRGSRATSRLSATDRQRSGRQEISQTTSFLDHRRGRLSRVASTSGFCPRNDDISSHWCLYLDWLANTLCG